MASAAEIQLHANESELESGIPNPPNPLQLSAIPTLPQSILVNGNRQNSNKRISTWSKVAYRLFPARKKDQLVNNQTQVPATKSSSLNSNSTSKQSIPTAENPPRITESPISSLPTAETTPRITEPSISLTKSSHSVSAEVPSSAEGVRICPHQKGKLYINPMAPMPVEIKTKWEQELRPRLTEELRRLNLDYGCADLFIAGRKQNQLAPTIAILCTSLENKRNIAKRLKASKLSAEFESVDVRVEILVDLNFGLKGSLDFLFLDPEFPIEVQLPETEHCFNGLLIRAKESSNQSTVCATLGGLIMIDEKLYGLTVGHTFARGFKRMMFTNGFGNGLGGDEKQAPMSTVDLESDEESSIWSEDEISLNSTDSFNEELETPKNKPINQTGMHFQKYSSPPASKTSPLGSIVSALGKPLSLVPTHSSQPALRPSFKAAVAEFARIPDDGERDIEATFQNLAGKYRKIPPIKSSPEKPQDRTLENQPAWVEQAVNEPKSAVVIEPESAVVNELKSAVVNEPKSPVVNEPKNPDHQVQPSAEESIVISNPTYLKSLENHGENATPISQQCSGHRYRMAYSLNAGSKESYNSTPRCKRDLSPDEHSVYRQIGSLNALGWACDRYLPWHKMSGWIYGGLYQFRTSFSNSDWALVTLDTDMMHKLNVVLSKATVGRAEAIRSAEGIVPASKVGSGSSILKSDFHDSTEFGSRVIDAEELGAIEVEIQGGKSGLQSGILNQCPSSIILMKNLFTIRQITLQRPLELGDSGAWVTHKGQLCGVTIAGGDMLPFAYMLSINPLLREIRNSLGVNISVPMDDEIDHTFLASRGRVSSLPIKDAVGTGQRLPSFGSLQNRSAADIDINYRPSNGTFRPKQDEVLGFQSYLSTLVDKERRIEKDKEERRIDRKNQNQFEQYRKLVEKTSRWSGYRTVEKSWSGNQPVEKDKKDIEK
ncbi:hypothetical protein MMC22_003426 [Lobaria immixta]|nr:hypothetical protein [Lobaria immixta]